MGTRGNFRRTLSSWANSASQEAKHLQHTYAEPGVTRIVDAPDREMVRLRGVLRTVTLRPRGGVAGLEAELFDGSEILTLVWLGRRRILGVKPGVSMQVRGRIGRYDGVRTMYNPRYELIPESDE